MFEERRYQWKGKMDERSNHIQIMANNYMILIDDKKLIHLFREHSVTLSSPTSCKMKL